MTEAELTTLVDTASDADEVLASLIEHLPEDWPLPDLHQLAEAAATAERIREWAQLALAEERAK